MDYDLTSTVTLTPTELGMSDVTMILKQCAKDFPFSIGNPKADLASIINKLYSNANWVLSYSEDHKLLGFIAFYINCAEGYAYIPYIWVDSQMRGHHCGSKMIEILKSFVCGQVAEIRLEVRKDNDSAMCFYLNKGFTVSEERLEKLLLVCKL